MRNRYVFMKITFPICCFIPLLIVLVVSTLSFPKFMLKNYMSCGILKNSYENKRGRKAAENKYL